MLIAVNTRMLLPGRLEGIGYFCKETVSRLVLQHPEHRFLFIFDRDFDQEFIFSENVTGIRAGLPARHPILWHLWYEHALPAVFKKWKPDLFVSPDGYVSLRSSVPTLDVIHDINFEHYPKDLPFLIRNYYRHYFPKFAARSERIVTVSEFSKTDISTKYVIHPDKIDVVYNGVNEGFQPISDEKATRIRQRWTQGRPYFLFIGSIHQRKNIVNHIKAFDRFKEKATSDLQLVFAGANRWWTDDMQRTLEASPNKTQIHFTGRVSEHDLHDITGAAFAVTYVSTFEGFGIPILEGMRSGVPVLTAEVTSMPEISADAALTVNPFDAEAIAVGMLKLFSDERLRISLTEKGLKRSRSFTWEKTAAGLWDCIERTIASAKKH
ncbi:MAG: glycosyltransferase family 4 protein [Bacteroidota bacterium]